MTTGESLQRVVVTGGSGFIGTHVMRMVRAQHIEAIALSRSGECPGLVRADIRDRHTLETILLPGDAVIHLANSTNPTTSESDRIRDVEENLVGTLQLLEACVNKSVSKFVFASSGGTVYGIPSAIPIPETHETNPISAHGAMKLAAEKYVQMYGAQMGLEYLILRCANAYGPGQTGKRGQGIIGQAIQKALRDETLEIWGDGTVVRDFIYVEDVAEALLLAITSEATGEVVNIGSGTRTSVNDIVDLVGRAVGRPLRVTYTPSRPIDVPVSILDITKAASVLNWNPRTPIEDGISLCHEWAAGRVTELPE
jgi:UDP-glucose 4-epimerase